MPHRPAANRPVGAGLRPRPFSPGAMEAAIESVGADPCVGPPTVLHGTRSRADTQVRPYAGWKVFRTTQASGAQRSVCGAGAREWAGIGAGITPKEPSTRDNPSVSLRLTAPFARGSLSPRGTKDADCRVASLLAMTVLNLCHSEKAQRTEVGIRPFLRWTGDGPPRSSAPTEGLPKPQQQAGVGIGPYGKPNQPPKPAGAQRSVRARGREGWAGIDARTIPKGDRPRDHPGSA